MKIREKMKRFFTLGRSADGFTLVELIVVIAILAILAGVAVPAYSGYIGRTNKAADQKLARDVANALQMHYYNTMGDSDSGFTGTTTVVLTANGVDMADTDDFAKAALEEAFGEKYSEQKLMYDGWKSNVSASIAQNFKESSYSGKENALLGQIGNLTNQLTGLLAEHSAALVGSSFQSYLDDMGIDGTSDQEVANAAVLYAAQITTEAEKNNPGGVSGAFETFYAEKMTGNTEALGNLTQNLSDQLGIFGACAAIYGHAEAYCQQSSDPTLLDEFHTRASFDPSDSTISTNQVLQQVGDAFNYVVSQAAQNDPNALTYIQNQSGKDVNAYLGAMEALQNNNGSLIDNLGDPNCFTDGTAANLLTGYMAAASANVSDGEVAIVLSQTATGIVVITIPADFN